jgi:hypothetical protein
VGQGGPVREAYFPCSFIVRDFPKARPAVRQPELRVLAHRMFL